MAHCKLARNNVIVIEPYNTTFVGSLGHISVYLIEFVNLSTQLLFRSCFSISFLCLRVSDVALRLVYNDFHLSWFLCLSAISQSNWTGLLLDSFIVWASAKYMACLSFIVWLGPLDGGCVPEGLLGQCRCWGIGRSLQAEGICLTFLLGWKNVGCRVTWPSWQHCLSPQQSVMAMAAHEQTIAAWHAQALFSTPYACVLTALLLCLVNMVSEMQCDRSRVLVLSILVEAEVCRWKKKGGGIHDLRLWPLSSDGWNVRF